MMSPSLVNRASTVSSFRSELLRVRDGEYTRSPTATDEKRLLDAMAPRYGNLSDDEKRRNKWGNNVLFVFEAHPLYSSLEALYGKRKKDEVSFAVFP